MAVNVEDLHGVAVDAVLGIGRKVADALFGKAAVPIDELAALALGIDEHIVTATQYHDLDYMDGLAEIIRKALGIPKPHLTRAQQARNRQLRQRLYEELELIDGVHWNGRERARERTCAAPVADDEWDVVPVDAYGI